MERGARVKAGRRFWPITGLASLVAAGCFDPPREALERLAAVKQEGASVEKALLELESRLLANQAIVGRHRELAERHRHVSALACRSAELHGLQMIAFKERELEKLYRKRARRRVAKTEPPREPMGGPAPVLRRRH